MSQSLWNRAVSYDTMNVFYVESERSQSLWNRAVSYDITKHGRKISKTSSQSLWNRAVSYDQENVDSFIEKHSLNPFGTGQCLTTFLMRVIAVYGSQSLWNRAVSYDV